MKPAVVLLVMVGLLVGCGGQTAAGPSPLPALTSTPSSAVPVTPTAPSAGALPVVPKPADADAFTAAGAESFVRYYVAVINQALLSNDPRLLASLSSPECGGCQDYVNSINLTAAAKGHVESGQLAILGVAAPPIENAETVALLDFTSTEYVSRAPDGSVLQRFPATARLTAELRCVRLGESWRIMGLRLSKPMNGKK